MAAAALGACTRAEPGTTVTSALSAPPKISAALREVHLEGPAATLRVDLIGRTVLLVGTPSTTAQVVAAAQEIARRADLRWITNA